MKKIKVGVIGLGFMGTQHLKVYHKLKDAEIAAIADVDPRKRACDFGAVCGNISDGESELPDLSNASKFEDGLEMIAKADVDVVDICVPTPFHTRYLLAALSAGKHVFSEKPLCRNREEMVQIVQAVKAASARNQSCNIGMCIRMWPEYAHAYNLIKSGTVGAIVMAHFRRLSPDIDGNAWQNWYMKEANSGGAVMDLHLHDTDFICHLLGRPKSVNSWGKRGVTSDNGIDQVFTRYEFENSDAMITAEGGWCAAKGTPFEMSFQIICEKATIKFDASGYKIIHRDGTVEIPQAGDPNLPTGWHQELNYFISCIRDGVVPNRYQTIDSISDAFQVVLAETESVDAKKSVAVQYV